jgi:hypothetical protein
MSQITISKLDELRYEVRVQAASPTTHTVTILPEYAQQFTFASIEDLLEQSFEFLLQREPNTSILRNFELSVIERYFPEYQTQMNKRR